MKNFIKGNWFKLTMLLVLAWFITVLDSGIDINVTHRGSIQSNYDIMDGITIYSNYDDTGLRLR